MRRNPDEDLRVLEREYEASDPGDFSIAMRYGIASLRSDHVRGWTAVVGRMNAIKRAARVRIAELEFYRRSHAGSDGFVDKEVAKMKSKDEEADLVLDAIHQVKRSNPDEDLRALTRDLMENLDNLELWQRLLREAKRRDLLVIAYKNPFHSFMIVRHAERSEVFTEKGRFEDMVLIQGGTSWSDASSAARFVNDIELVPASSREGIHDCERCGEHNAAAEETMCSKCKAKFPGYRRPRSYNPRRRNSDRDLRSLERRASQGDPGAAAGLLAARFRNQEFPERNLRVAALMGVPEAALVLGLDKLSPQEARDELLLVLDTSDRVYSVLWAWASAIASLSTPIGEGLSAVYREECFRILRLVESWLSDPMSERSQACRDAAFALGGALAQVVETQRLAPSGPHFSDTDLLVTPFLPEIATAYASLAVDPWTTDFPGFEGGQPVFPVMNQGLDLLDLNLDAVRDSLKRRFAYGPGVRVTAHLSFGNLSGEIVSEPYASRPGVMSVQVRWSPCDAMPEGGEGEWPVDSLTPVEVAHGGVLVPSLADPTQGLENLLDKLATNKYGVSTLVTRADVAVAAMGHLAATWSLVEADKNRDVTLALRTIEAGVADLVRPWLLGPNLTGAFRHGRLVLSIRDSEERGGGELVYGGEE